MPEPDNQPSVHHPFGVAPYRMPKAAYWWLFLWSICVFFLAGWITIYWVTEDWWPGYVSTKWPTVQGIIFRSEVNEYRKNRGGLGYELNVAYRYQVAHVQYEGNRIGFTESRLDDNKATCEQRLKDDFPLNKKCAVYYDPAHPSISCLQPGGNIGFALTFAAVSLALFAYGFYSLKLACRGLLKSNSIQSPVVEDDSNTELARPVSTPSHILEEGDTLHIALKPVNNQPVLWGMVLWSFPSIYFGFKFGQEPTLDNFVQALPFTLLWIAFVAASIILYTFNKHLYLGPNGFLLVFHKLLRQEKHYRPLHECIAFRSLHRVLPDNSQNNPVRLCLALDTTTVPIKFGDNIPLVEQDTLVGILNDKLTTLKSEIVPSDEAG